MKDFIYFLSALEALEKDRVNTLVNKRVSKWMKFKRFLCKETGWWLKVIGFREFGE